MSKKVSGILMYINRIQDSLSKEARLIAVQTLVLSHLNYAINVLGTVNITQLKSTEAAKLCCQSLTMLLLF